MQVSVLDFDCSGGNFAYVINIKKRDEVSNLVTWTVHRHYHHLVELRRNLRERFPFCIIPPLPSKMGLIASFRKRLRTPLPYSEGCDGQQNWNDPYSPSLERFLGKRCYTIELFLHHMLNHRHINDDGALLSFFCNEPILLKSPTQVASNKESPSDVHHRPGCTPDVHTCASLMLEFHEVGATMVAGSPSLMHSSLLRSRAEAMKMYWAKFSMLVSTLDNRSLRSHRKHRLLSDALFDWTPYESNLDSQSINAVLTASNKWRYYASLMDAAKEESARLQEHCSMWQSYADLSLPELHHLCKNMQANLVGVHQPTSQNQQFENIRYIIDEVVAFEELQLDGTYDVFKEFATVKLRQAERCSLTWQKILSTLQSLKYSVTGV